MYPSCPQDPTETWKDPVGPFENKEHASRARDKCAEWLKPDTSPFIKRRFGIERFKYALAILIDFTDGQEYFTLWESFIKTIDYSQLGIFPVLISAVLPMGSSETFNQHRDRAVESQVSITKSASQKDPFSSVKEDEKLADHQKIESDPPMIYLDSLVALESFDEVNLPGTGYSFFPDDLG